LEIRPSTNCFSGLCSLPCFEEIMNIDIDVDERLKAFPQIYCAFCCETITDATEGNLIFKEARTKKPRVIKTGIYTVHKLCDRPFTHSYPCDPGERYSWIPLDAALYMLLRNCHYKPAEAKRGAELAAY